MMKKKHWTYCLAVCCLLAAALLACGQGGSPTAESGSSDGVDGNTGSGRETGITEEPTEHSVPAERLVEAPGIAEITLLTPTEGGGLKPQFSWEPLSGAARYMLVLYAASGETYWAWEGETTSVYLGGGDTSPLEDSAGPVLSEGMSWGVMAFDSDGLLIGSSMIQTISP